MWLVLFVLKAHFKAKGLFSSTVRAYRLYSGRRSQHLRALGTQSTAGAVWGGTVGSKVARIKLHFNLSLN